MEKPWRVSHPWTGTEEDFATEQEALAFADGLLSDDRAEAQDSGEWNAEVELLRIYKLVHSAQVDRRDVDDDGRETVDYDLLPVS